MNEIDLKRKRNEFSKEIAEEILKKADELLDLYPWDKGKIEINRNRKINSTKLRVISMDSEEFTSKK